MSAHAIEFRFFFTSDRSEAKRTMGSRVELDAVVRRGKRSGMLGPAKLESLARSIVRLFALSNVAIDEEKNR